MYRVKCEKQIKRSEYTIM